MKAVIETGGKQYKVQEGDVIRIETIAGNPGDAINFESVLLVFDEKTVTVGKPLVPDALVRGTFVKEDKEKKIIIFKMKRRKGYRLKKGHRQKVSVVKIEEIALGAKKVKVSQDKKDVSEKGAKQEVENGA
ncbi:50S ribosomal protein L21 [Chlamydiota bacterium]